MDLNDLFEYNTNTNKAIEGKGIMLTHPLGFEQFGHGVNKKHA